MSTTAPVLPAGPSLRRAPVAGPTSTAAQQRQHIADVSVVVPQVNHSTIETILATNKTLIKILLEYQNNGWMAESEYKMQVDTARHCDYALYRCYSVSYFWIS
eukprot:jgi/Hompol1/2464/HPOL_000083-RA